MPTGLKIAPNGDFWVVDTVSKKLTQLDRTTGQREREVQFDGPLDNLAIGSEGEIYVSDVSRNAIHVYTAASGNIRELIKPRIAIPAGIALSEGQLWVADGYVLRSLDLETGTVHEKFPDIPAAFPFTTSLRDGRLAISSTFTNVVEVFDKASGKRITQIAGLSAPSDALLLDDGSLIFSEYGKGQIVRASGGDFSKRNIIAADLDGPVQMTVADGEKLYFTESSGAVKEVLLSSPGEIRVVVSGLRNPEGLAVTPWGSLVIAEVGSRSLIEIDPKSGQKSAIAEKLPIGLPVPSSLPAYAIPTGVAVDQNGTIYLAADEDNAIYRVRACK